MNTDWNVSVKAVFVLIHYCSITSPLKNDILGVIQQ